MNYINEKLLQLGFEYQYLDFDKGLKETFNWYKKMVKNNV